MSFANDSFNRTALHQIRDILKLPPQASHADLVARVRELKAVEDLSLAVHQRAKSAAAGEALQIERDSSMAITPETFAAWNHHDMENPTELTLFSDGSGILCNDQGDRLHEFETPTEFAAFFD